MNNRILEQAELICEQIFPDNEIGQCLLYHELACFSEFVALVAVKEFRDGLKKVTLKNYEPEPVKHG